MTSYIFLPDIEHQCRTKKDPWEVCESHRHL